MNLHKKFAGYFKRLSLRYAAKFYAAKYGIPHAHFELAESVEEVLTIAHYVKEEVNLLDVGANIGEYSFLFSRIIKCKKIVCVEPNITLNDQISGNLKGENHVILNNVVGNNLGKVTFQIHEDSQMSSVEDIDEEKMAKYLPSDNVGAIKKVEIESLTLKELLERGAMEGAPIFLKLDTQGNEMDILEGGKEVIGKIKYCMIEHVFNSMYTRETDFNDMFKFFSDNGFDCLCPTNYKKRFDHTIGAVNFLFVNRSMK